MSSSVTIGLGKPTLGWRALCIIWTTLGLLSFTRYLLLNGTLKHGLISELLGWLTCYYSWLILTPLIFRLEQRFPLAKRRWSNLVTLAFIGLPLSYFAYQITIFLNGGVQWVLKQPVPIPARWWSFPAREFGLEQALYWFTVGAGCLIRNYWDLREKERLAVQLEMDKAELEASLRQAELENLRMRLNPHFLFNSLQSISTLSQKDPKTASLMISRLGDLLRVALNEHSNAESTLEMELTHTDAYIAIEKMRFSDKLSVLHDIAPETTRALVPSFMLQPLVENAVKHGLQSNGTLGLIWIKSRCEDERLVLSVSDNGVGISGKQLTDLEIGTGLGSTCERLKRMYGDEYSFSIQQLSEGGTEVRIALPLKYLEAQREKSLNDTSASLDRR